MDFSGRFTYANSAVERIHGWTVEEFLELTFRDAVTPRAAVKYATAIEEEIARVTTPQYDRNWIRTFESEHSRKDGSTFWAEVSATFLWSDDGKPAGIIGITRDISARKHMEEQLAESRNYLDQIINAIADPIFVKDRQHRWVLLNNAHNNFFGRDAKELLGKTDYDFFPRSEADVFWSKDEAVFTTGLPNINEEHFTDAKGKVYTIVTKKSLYTNEKGEKFIVGIIRDITERNQTEEAVEESRQMLRSVLDTIPARVFWKDLAGRFVGCNHQFARDAGFDSPEALVGKDDYAMGWKDQADLYRADDQKIIASGVPKLYYEEFQTTPAGKQLWLRTSKIPLRDLEGRIVGVLGAYEDITERKRAEERIREQAALLDAANDAIYVRALDHTVTYWNDGAERLYGWTRAEALGRKITELGGIDAAAFEAAHATLLEQGHWSGELKMTSKAGKELGRVLPLDAVAGRAGPAQGNPGHQHRHHRAETAGGQFPPRPAHGGHRRAGRRHRPRPEQYPPAHPDGRAAPARDGRRSRKPATCSTPCKPAPSAGRTSSSNCSPLPAASPACACRCRCATSCTRWTSSSAKPSRGTSS